MQLKYIDPKLFFLEFDTYFWLFTIAAVAVGACVGSFLNVVIWRVPQSMGVIRVPSHCPCCHHKIPFWFNIPVVSWLALGGRCHYCKVRIPPRYFFLEVLTSIIFLAVWMQAWRYWQFRIAQVGDGTLWPIEQVGNLWLLFSLLIALSFVDIDHRIIPDGIVIFGVVCALVLAVLLPGSHGYQLAEPPGSLENLHQKPALVLAIRGIIPRFPALVNSPRILAAIDSILGIVFGGGIIWFLSEIGKLLKGKTTIEMEEPVLVQLTAEGYDTPDEGYVEWEDTFIRSRDKMIVHGKMTELTVTSSQAPTIPNDEEMFVITEQGLSFRDSLIPLEEIKSIKFQSNKWTIPLEPMGLGDATMMAMIGSFIGPGPIIMILCLASFIGAFMGLLKVIVRSSRLHSAMAFGPFIAMATFFYVLFEKPIIRCWVSLLMRR